MLEPSGCCLSDPDVPTPAALSRLPLSACTQVFLGRTWITDVIQSYGHVKTKFTAIPETLEEEFANATYLYFVNALGLQVIPSHPCVTQSLCLCKHPSLKVDSALPCRVLVPMPAPVSTRGTCYQTMPRRCRWWVPEQWLREFVANCMLLCACCFHCLPEHHNAAVPLALTDKILSNVPDRGTRCPSYTLPFTAATPPTSSATRRCP